MSKRADNKDLELAGPALRGFMQIAKAWRLTEDEKSAILGVPAGHASALLESGLVEACWPETMERISYVFGIYGALHTIFPDRLQADSWIRRPSGSSAFNGDTALALMRAGQLSDLATVRQHLYAVGLDEP
ncbi:hypothetical protein [Stenotrophomonas cyclobalanopsidis]|uniref:hypothetical protein n=1 Tax=Stenotrophomonas cyclobalanopsidis TaxID=2771362 RepID=UPI0034614F80